MRRLALALLMLLNVVLFSAAAVAQEQPESGEKPEALKGVVVRVDDESLVVSVKAKGESAKEQVVRTSAATVVKVDGERSNLESIEPGMRVTVPAYEGSAKTVTATSPRVRGTVVRVEGDTVVMLAKVDGGGETEMPVPTTKQTVVRVDGKKATLADVKPGMSLSVPKFKASAKRVDARNPKSDSEGDADDEEKPRKEKRKDAKDGSTTEKS